MKCRRFARTEKYDGYIDDENWKCFVNSRYHRDSMKWTLKKVLYVELIKD